MDNIISELNTYIEDNITTLTVCKISVENLLAKLEEHKEEGDHEETIQQLLDIKSNINSLNSELDEVEAIVEDLESQYLEDTPTDNNV